MRVFTILIGMAGVAVTYFLGRELFGARAGLIAMFFMAVSRWDINFSRIVFTNILVPLFGALTFYLLLRALRTQRVLDFIWVGITMGIGISTYLSYRVFPVLVVVYLLYRFVANRSFLRSYWRGLVIMVFAAIIAFIPLGVYFQKHPGDFMSRAQAASVQQDIQREKSNAPLYANIRKAFGMFNYQGDPRPRHNLPNSPMLDPITGIFFVLGCGYCLLKWKNTDNTLLTSWLVIGVLPGVLSLADSNPHSARTIGNIPAVCLIAAIAVERCWAVARTRWGKRGEVRFLAVAAVLAALVVVANAYVYFGVQAKDRNVYYDFDPVQTNVAQEVARLAKTSKVYVAAAFTNHSAVKLLDDGLPYQTFNQAQHLPVRDVGDKDVAFLLEPVHRPLLTLFQKYYPYRPDHQLD